MRVLHPLSLVPVVALLIISSPSAVDAEASCPDGWSAVGDSECELLVLESGDVTMPAGVERVDALVVGGGGGGGGANLFDVEFVSPGGTVKSYGGGGGGAGEVTVCAGLEITGTVAATVGLGGVGGDGAVDPAASTDGGDGEPSAIGACSAAGGFGGQSDSDPTAAGGAGGASGAGFAGGPAYFAGNGGGGGGAGSDGDGSEPARGGNGGRGYFVTGGCFTGSQIELAMGGGGGASYKVGGGVSFSWDWESRTAASGGNARKYVWNADAQDWLVIDAPQIDSGDGASSSLLDTYEKYAAGDGGANSGGGGGGGVSWQPYRDSDGILYRGDYFPGGDGGSGVVVLRYSTAGAPTIESAFFFADPVTGSVTVNVGLADLSCEVSSVMVGDTVCDEIAMVNELRLQCVLPAGEYDGATISVTDGGGTSVASLGGGPGDGGGGDGGGGDGSGDGSGTGDTATGELPATGSRGVVFITASLVVIAGLVVRRIGQRRSIASA